MKDPIVEIVKRYKCGYGTALNAVLKAQRFMARASMDLIRTIAVGLQRELDEGHKLTPANLIILNLLQHHLKVNSNEK